MQHRWKLLITLFCLTFVSSAWAGPLPIATPEEVGMSSERLERIDAALAADIEGGKLPGAVALVARKGKVVYFKSFGWRDKESGSLMKKDSMFRVYSMTKPFASVAAMILLEEGKLLLSDPVSKYIPAFKDVKVGVIEKNDAGEETVTTVDPKTVMTVHHLLTHTSGLNYWFYPPKSIQKMYLDADMKDNNHTVEEMSNKLAQIPLISHPGERYQYSHAFDVLSRVVEVASGMPMDEFLEERIFQPLGMEDTGFRVEGPDQGRLVYLTPEDPLYKGYSEPTIYFGGGSGTVSTVADYARFSQMLLNGGELDGVRLLGPKTVAYMASDHLGSLGNRSDRGYVPGVGYGNGFGFYVRVDAGRSPFLGNVGEFYKGGYAGTCFWVDPEEELVAVFMVSAPKHRVFYRHLMKSLIYQAILD